MVYLVRLNLMAGIKYALFGGPRVRMQLMCIVVAGIVALAAALVITHRAFDGFGAPTPSASRGALLWQAFPQGRPPEYRVEEPKYRRMWPTITSEEEPWGLRTMADGDVYPDAVPAGSYLQHRQRGRIVVYTVEEVQDMLAGVGDFCWMPPYPKFTSPNPAIRGLPVWNTTDDGDNNATSMKLAVNDSSSSNNMTSNQTNVAGDRCDLTHSGAGAKATPLTMHERRQRRLAAILNPPPRYTPVVIFADLGLVNAQSENLPAEWVMYELIRARVTDAVIVAVFVHRQRVEAALNLKLAQEYLRLPGVMRVMTTWLFDDPPAGCEGMLQLADVIQPHLVIATADELSFRTCTVKNVSQRCYGADRNWPNCTRPVALAEYTNYGVEGVAHVPSLVYPGTLMRPLRRADTPEGPRGTNRFHGWPLPFGRPWWEAARFAVCPQWEPKYVEPLPGAYVNANLRPLSCNDTKRCALSPLYNPPCPRPPWEPAPANHTCTHRVNAAANNNNNNSSSADNNSTNRSGCSNDAGVAASLQNNNTVAASPTSADDYWEFPPRHTFPFRPPPVERPRRLAWSLVGSTHYGDRMTATIAFARAFIGLPSLVKSGGLERVDAFRSVLCDSVFVPMGGGVVAYEAIRAHEAMRCGTIPVISTSALSVKGVLGEPLPIGHPDSAYRTLIGFEGQWPDGWLVADTWAEAAAMARRVLDTPGEVVRLRRLVMGAHARMVNLMHERVRVAARRAANPAHFWDEHAAWAAYYLSVSPFHSR